MTPPTGAGPLPRSGGPVDAGSFRVTTTIDAYEGELRVLARSETFIAPRRLV